MMSGGPLKEEKLNKKMMIIIFVRSRWSLTARHALSFGRPSAGVPLKIRDFVAMRFLRRCRCNTENAFLF